MPETQELELEARILALEYLVKQILWSLTVLRVREENGDHQLALRELELLRTQTKRDLAKASTSHADAALSDHMTDMVRQNVEEFLASLVREVEAIRGRPLSERGVF